MKIDVPKIVRTLALSTYAAELGEAVIHVWVNPPRELIDKHDALVTESASLRKVFENEKATEAEQAEAIRRMSEIGAEHFVWYAELWSQGPEDTHLTTADAQQLAEETASTDPSLWPWLTRRTVEMIQEHRAGQKKG